MVGNGNKPSLFKTGGFHKYKITVDPILGTIPDNVYLEAELKIDRFMK